MIEIVNSEELFLSKQMGLLNLELGWLRRCTVQRQQPPFPEQLKLVSH